MAIINPQLTGDEKRCSMIDLDPQNIEAIEAMSGRVAEEFPNGAMLGQASALGRPQRRITCKNNLAMNRNQDSRSPNW